mmetsp:Transcript_32908/g.84971  ORF Transcript_32908/g.84971 Transcript_32908/m.84971 type:complete len:273 (-) Transcript_32908:596-1414(-)|eukprot:CAMPEP_0113881588 /NCGR_PEP_ID=MMETSP0780_2-20120614/8461_1 /TAXON_ID=652834 /ORGANISM="Palpitomonas bilix" /LENGTH=272 /DNA_ID=CAMNT_0000868465 /DNA_START=84 /DNA_END=902 /DNA_ORIENTATION=- /assembly_acc=CAM_ASM_000599
MAEGFPYHALLLSTIAGLSTGVGGLVVYIFRYISREYLSLSLGFAAGAMGYLSIVELLMRMVEQQGALSAAMFFLLGAAFVYVLEKLTPHTEIGHSHGVEEESGDDESGVQEGKPSIAPADSSLLRSGLITATALALHNFPEGLAVGVSTVQSSQLGIAMAIAIAMHNIPEGIAVAVPLAKATGDRVRAVLITTLTGLAEPLGALISLLVLQPFLNAYVIDALLCGVGGVMSAVTVFEIAPAAKDKRYFAAGAVTGMVFIAFNLHVLGADIS